eukprot:gene6744-7838_t
MSKFLRKLTSSSDQVKPQEHSEVVEEVLPEGKKEILMHLIKQIKLNSEIKHMTLPCFLLQTRGMLESFSDTFGCIEEFFKVQSIENEEARFIQLVKFVLSAWSNKPKGIKKPFNPVIGEVFDCYWDPVGSSDSVDDRSHFVSEQVSHHPPHSAFCFYNKKEGVIVNGNICPSYVKFYGNYAESALKGLVVIHLLKTNETFELTLPTVGVRGILLGKLGSYVCGKTTLRKTDGSYSCTMDFTSKSLISSSRHHNGIKGAVSYKGKSLYKLKGHWDNQVFITPTDTHNDDKLMDVREMKPTPPIVPPLSEQPENSSHKATTDEKIRIEAKQRSEEAYRKENGIVWIPQNFILRPYSNEHPNTYIYKDLELIFPEFQSKPTN